jgi:hypothetical protein
MRPLSLTGSGLADSTPPGEYAVYPDSRPIDGDDEGRVCRSI